MKIVVVGGGKVGFSLAAQLTKEGHDLTLIDTNRSVVRHIAETIDAMAVCGNGASLSVQRQASVNSADLLIAATAQDEVNMVCCIIAKKLGCKNTIARIRNPEYAEQMYFLKDELGLSMTINPELIAAREIFRLMQLPGFLKRDTFAKGRVEIVEISLREDSILHNVPLMELAKKVGAKVLVCAVKRKGEVTIPGGTFKLQAGDKIYVTAPATELVALIHGLGMKQRKTRDAMIIGGSRIAQYLTAMLLKTGTRVKILEKNEAYAAMLAEKFPKATIINADGTAQDVLLEENADRMDTVVTLTNMDEENLIVSMYLNYINVPQVITKINHLEYTKVFEDKGIDCVVSPKYLCAQQIVRYVRAMQNSVSEDSILSLHHLVDGEVEALEFLITDRTRNRGQYLKDIKFKRNILISSIYRNGKPIIPGGFDTLESGDTVVVVTTAEHRITDINDIFA